MSGFMNPAEFANIAKTERDFWWYRGMRRILFRMMDPYLAGRKIRHALEAGCGTGFLSHLLQTERQLPVVPMDISADGLRYARGLGVERPVQGDTTHLPFADRAFDMVISLDVLVHMPPGEERAAVREMARVLAPGGLLVMRAAAFGWLRSRHSDFVGERQRYSRGRVLELLRDAGVRPLRCTYANSLLLPVALVKFRMIEPLLGAPANSGVEPVAPWLDRLLYAPLGIEAAAIGAGINFPIGQSVVCIGEKME